MIVFGIVSCLAIPLRAQTSSRQAKLDRAVRLNNQALALAEKGKAQEAIPLVKEAFALNKEIYGFKHPEVAVVASNVGEILWLNGSYSESRDFYEEAFLIRKAVLGEKHEKAIHSRRTLATLLTEIGEYELAVPHYQYLLKFFKEKYGDSSPAAAVSLLELGGVLRRKGDYDAARRYVEESVAVYRKSQGEMHANTASALLELGYLLRIIGDLAEAKRHTEEALEIRRRKFGEQSLEFAVALNYLASVCAELGDYRMAESLLQQAIQTRRLLNADSHPDHADILNNLAVVHKAVGAYELVEPLFLESLQIYRKFYGENNRHAANVLAWLGALSFEIGNRPRAKSYYEEALRINRVVLGEGHDEYALLLVSLGELHCDMGEYEKAMPYLLKALDTQKQSLGKTNGKYAATLDALASLYFAKQEYDRAMQLYVQSLQITKEVLGPKHPQVAYTIHNLAALRTAMSDPEEAEELLQEALKIYQEAFGSEHVRTSIILRDMAIIQAGQHKWLDAAKLADQSQVVANRYAYRVLPSLTTSEQSLFLSKNVRPFLHASLTLGQSQSANPEIANLSAGWLANGKAVAHEVTTQQAILAPQSEDPRTAELAIKLKSVRAGVAKLSQTSPSPEQGEGYRSKLSFLQLEEARLIHEIGGRLAALNRDQSWAEVEKLRQNIAEGHVLIDIARFDVFDFEAVGAENQWRPAHYAAWVTPPTNQGDIQVVDLGEADAIDELVIQARLAVEATQLITDNGELLAEQNASQALAELSELVLAPILAIVASETEKLLLSPDGNLWLVPWAALPLDEGRYAVEKYEFQLLVSARDLIPKIFTAAVNPKPVIMADPDFDLAPTAALAATQKILRRELTSVDSLAMRTTGSASALPRTVSRLPFTALEADAIKPNLERYAGKAPSVFLGQSALEGVFKALVRPRVLVLSTHGFFLEDQQSKPLNDNLLSSKARSIPLSAAGEPTENPLLRCGLILAGYNQRDRVSEGDDGVLTGMEIVGTDLCGTELVVLSACQTGVGQINNGEGVAGLRQAFQIAGAKSVVASLWQIPDFETALLMNDFFDNLAAGQSKPAALRNAQLSRIQSRREIHESAHPFFWAAFSVTGQ